MRRYLPHFFNSWIALSALLLQLVISWSISARFALPRVDESVWGNAHLGASGLGVSAIYFYLKKKKSITAIEVAKVALESLILITLWIIWLAPEIWNYTHAVELYRYITLSILYWFLFVFYFILGIYLIKYRERRKGIRRESDLNLFPELEVLLPGRKSFRTIRFDHKSDYYSFAFQTCLEVPKPFFDRVKDNAEGAGWTLENISEHRVSFRKRLDPSPPEYFDHLVTLTVDRNTGEVILVKEPYYEP